MDAKQACDKLNGFNFQNRYLVGKQQLSFVLPSCEDCANCRSVLYHQPDKMAKSKADLEERKANLEALKQQHGID
jgi:pre-mRNA branch site protein p14